MIPKPRPAAQSVFSIPTIADVQKTIIAGQTHIFSPLEIYIRPGSFPVLAVAGQSHKALPRDSLAYRGRKQMLGELLSHPINVWDKRP